MRRIAGVFALVTVISGCADKAEPAYQMCLALEGQGDLQGAIDSCTAVIQVDPPSKFRQPAGAKILDLKARLDAQEAAKKKAADEAAQAKAAHDEKCSDWCFIGGLGVGRHCEGKGLRGKKYCGEYEDHYAGTGDIERHCYCIDD